MKLTSINQLGEAFLSVLKKFPLESGFALIGAGAATYQVWGSWAQVPVESTLLVSRILYCSNLGLLLSLSATLFARSSGRKQLPFSFSALVITGLLFFVLNLKGDSKDAVRFLLFSLGFHFLVSSIAFIGKEANVDAFWQFNRKLFERILTGVLFSGVLFLGISTALVSSAFLFGWDVRGEVYGTVACWIIIFFQSLFFLYGVPTDEILIQKGKHYRGEAYSNWLKVFTQYVLIPLASLYLVILLAYELKMLIQWKLPQGMVSMLILGYAVWGILALLLVYPLRNQEDKKWIKIYSRWFYYLLIPLLVLFALAIGQRISDYGITEQRYFLLLLFGWLLSITLYFVFSPRQNIVLIPFSLAVLTLVSTYGPQSAFNVSKQSQLHQLKKLFELQQRSENGFILPLNHKVQYSVMNRFQDVSEYLIENHGLTSLQPLLKADLKIVSDSLSKETKKESLGNSYSSYDRSLRLDERTWFRTKYGLVDDHIMANTAKDIKRNLSANGTGLIPLNGAEYLVQISSKWEAGNVANVRAYYEYERDSITVRWGEDEISIDLLGFINDLEPRLAKGELQEESIPRELLNRKFLIKGYIATLQLERLEYGNELRKKDANTVLVAAGYILLKKPDKTDTLDAD